MDKTAYIALWDIYGELFTKTQYEICNMYYNYDLTVSEISVEKGVSRQAVSECIKSCERQLLSYEEKLKVLKKLGTEKERTKKLVRSIELWIDKNGDIQELKTLLQSTEE